MCMEVTAKNRRSTEGKDVRSKVKWLIYLPQLEQEQLEPQLPIISISYSYLQSEGWVGKGRDRQEHTA
jgi:hypothetical protein